MNAKKIRPVEVNEPSEFAKKAARPTAPLADQLAGNATATANAASWPTGATLKPRLSFSEKIERAEAKVARLAERAAKAEARKATMIEKHDAGLNRRVARTAKAAAKLQRTLVAAQKAMVRAGAAGCSVESHAMQLDMIGALVEDAAGRVANL